AVAVDLVRVGDPGAIVARRVHTVAVRIDRIRIAGIAVGIVVAVLLARIADRRAIVDAIGPLVPIHVLGIVARVAEAVLVGVVLIGVGNGRTVVDAVTDPVAL